MTSGSGRARLGPPLAVRLALVLSAVVLAVLLIAGAVVNRVVNQGFEDVVAQQQTEQVQAAADALGELLRQGGSLREARAILERLSHHLNAPVTVRGAAAAGPGITVGRPLPPDTPSRDLSAPVTVNDAEVATVSTQVPAGGAIDRPFLQLFNAVLVVGGLAAVAVIAVLAVVIARRQTKPLADVAAAAARLEAGDLTARTTGGGDRESQELAGAFNAMAGRLERSEMLRRRAASDMAHDLATPATVLESQLQAMIDGVAPKNRANLEAARASAAALGGVIVQLGELALAEAAPLHARPQVIDVAAAVAEAVASLDGLYRERGVSATVEPMAAGLTAVADPTHLGRALRNVLTNAAQHSPRGETVTVSATGDADQVAIRVIDGGPGIPEENVSHVFERFYRSDPARATGSGSGIGLTIARELLAASGGTIEVERTGADGTTMLIRLSSANTPAETDR